ncbi:AAA family ATPase [Stenotrophomonas sp. JAG2]|uniref:AAA family ATPase n=1 Tax=Stenotrophomonas sp. JAG2 TaxID=3229243 RepID=UPI0034E19C70
MSAHLISNVHIKGLFGLYTYSVPQEGKLTNAAILYGDNGVGKSTVLRLAFHLLSAAHNRGHRSALYQADFEKIEVSLASGIRLTAEVFQPKANKLLSLTVLSEDKPLAVWDYRPNQGRAVYYDDDTIVIEEDRGGRRIIRKVKKSSHGRNAGDVPHGEQVYLSVLKQHVPALFILNADRRLDSDSVSDPSDEVELRRTMQYGEPKRINELVARSREIALSQALSAAARWISRKAVLGTNQGSTNVHSVYGDVLRRIVSSNSRQGTTEFASGMDLQELLNKLVTIDSKSAEHARYELATHLPTSDFRNALGDGSKSALAAELLQPYIQSVESRLEAVEPTYQLIDRFVTIVNGLLSDKTITFKLSQGFSIQNRLGVPLSPAQLSSGEQQLLLLFCYVLTARDVPTVFMIDEPEISLNIKWQRQLVQSLLDITDGANIQFILASHSMELLAQHRNRVIKLENQS